MDLSSVVGRNLQEGCNRHAKEPRTEAVEVAAGASDFYKLLASRFSRSAHRVDV
jgi:hypothetical protein